MEWRTLEHFWLHPHQSASRVYRQRQPVGHSRYYFEASQAKEEPEGDRSFLSKCHLQRFGASLPHNLQPCVVEAIGLRFTLKNCTLAHRSLSEECDARRSVRAKAPRRPFLHTVYTLWSIAIGTTSGVDVIARQLTVHRESRTVEPTPSLKSQTGMLRVPPLTSQNATPELADTGFRCFGDRIFH